MFDEAREIFSRFSVPIPVHADHSHEKLRFATFDHSARSQAKEANDMVSWKLPRGWAGPLEGKDPWPLRFYRYNFGARHYNTQRCSIVYNNDSFTRLTGDKPKGPPHAPDWQDNWSGGYSPYTYDPIWPVEVSWTSLDGSSHEAVIDLEALFKNQLILHNLRKENIPEGWLAAGRSDPVSPHILVEVNDRTINVYMRAHIATKELQKPGNQYSDFRNDLILAWTHTY